MEDYKKIKEELEQLRQELIDYISTQDEGQDLTEKFILVRESDLATYELLMLIYQEFKTLQKMNKKKLTTLLNKEIGVKIKTIDKIMADINKSDDKPKTIQEWLLTHLTFKNIFKGVSLIAAIIVLLFTLYSINSEAYTKVTQDGFKLIEETKSTVKGE